MPATYAGALDSRPVAVCPCCACVTFSAAVSKDGLCNVCGGRDLSFEFRCPTCQQFCRRIASGLCSLCGWRDRDTQQWRNFSCWRRWAGDDEL